jgi:alginate O-acetyltransferase complex protein AlgI
VLLTASLWFYAAAGPVYLLQLLTVIGAVYGLALRIEGTADAANRKRLVTLGVLGLLANLFTFKYLSFANESARALLGWMGASYPVPELRLALPLGISFYSLQLISYLVDVYRKTVPAERHAGIFALYVTFYPKMVAGPIERAKDLLPQLHKPQPFVAQRVALGLQLVAWGAFKKVVVSDRIAPYVRKVFDDPRSFDGVTMTAATLLFAIQLYCDFSGYSDIAVGTAQTLGYKLTQNFNRPYAATSVQDFWKRWHISLSNWLTDYVYTPLTRTKVLKIKWYYLTLVSIFATFVASGLWHGAAWTFVAWGALHGAYLVVSLETQKWRRKTIKRVKLDRTPRLLHALRVAYVFSLVCVAYVLFQANSLADAWYVFSHAGTGWTHARQSLRLLFGGQRPDVLLIVFGAVIVLAVDVLRDRVKSLRREIGLRPYWQRWSLYYGVVLSVVLLGAFYGGNQQFIYFKF